MAYISAKLRSLWHQSAIVSLLATVTCLLLPANSQLNQNCIVSVLNRNVQVNADGTWVLPNIPANFGPVRARATCVTNGITQFGQSSFFILPANSSTDVPPIVLAGDDAHTWLDECHFACCDVESVGEYNPAECGRHLCRRSHSGCNYRGQWHNLQC